MQPEPAFTGRIALPGSEREHVANANDQGPVDPDQEAEVTLHLRSRTSDDEFQKKMNALSMEPVANRRYLSREELSELRGANPQDIARVEEFANRHHLSVANSNPGARTVTLRGKLGDLQDAFGVQLRRYEADGQQFRGRKGAIYLPSDLAPAVTGVFGLDTRPAAKPKSAQTDT